MNTLGMNELSEDIKSLIIGNKTFKQIAPKSTDQASHFHDVFCIINEGNNKFAIGPESCKPEEIIRMLSKALEIDESKFHIETELSEIIKERLKQDLDDAMMSRFVLNYSAFEDTLCDLFEQYNNQTKDAQRSETIECKDISTSSDKLPKLPKIETLKSLYDEDDSIRYYETDRAVVELWSYIISKRIEQQTGLAMSIFPAFLIFELYLYKTVEKVYCSVFETRYQNTSDYIHNTPDYSVLHIRPDVCIYTFDGKPVTIMDAKYKTYTRKRCYGDVRQISTYVKRLGPAPGIIVYPGFLNADQLNDTYYDEESQIGFMFIDIMNDEASLNSYMDSIGVKTALTDILNSQL